MTTLTSRARTSPARLALAAVAAISVTVGLPFFATAFMFSYFMNDLPGQSDHLSFSRIMALGAVVAAIVISLTLRANGWQSSHAIACAVGGSAAVTGFFLAIFFGSSTQDIADAGGYDSWTSGQVAAWAAVCGTVGVVGLAVAVIASRRANR